MSLTLLLGYLYLDVYCWTWMAQIKLILNEEILQKYLNKMKFLSPFYRNTESGKLDYSQFIFSISQTFY